MEFRDYQIKMHSDVLSAWSAGHQNVLAVAPTGAGKTIIKAKIFHESTSPGIAIAHRQELVGQISLALARLGVEHRILAPNPIMQFCVMMHVREVGRSFVNPDALIGVAGVRSLLSEQADRHRSFIRQVRLWDLDEGHHALPDNQWGKAIATLPAGYGVGFTATPQRCDRKPLGRSQGGIFDHMVLGPSPRALMDRGFLSRYRIYGPPPSFDRSEVKRSKRTGEFVPASLRTVAEKSTITGDVVDHYLKLAPGKIGLTFCVDLKIAHDTAQAFCQRGVPAVAVSGKTPDAQRQEALDRLARGDLKQVTNVDLFGEGMDCPVIECVSMARPTESLGLYLQQFGRLLRPSPGKDFGILIDHVGNVQKHGLPDTERNWSLSIDKLVTKQSDAKPIRICGACMLVFESFLTTCPFCGFKPPIEERSKPEHVEGDLIEYTPEMIKQLQGEIDRIDGPPVVPRSATDLVAAGIAKQWSARQESQRILREAISFWAGVFQQIHGETDSEIWRRFYHTFGLDIMTAQSLGASDATKLTEQIRSNLS